MRGIIVASCVAALTAAAGCGRQESAWQEARREDTRAGYAGYMQRYPAGAHAADARAAIRSLDDDAAWALAERIGTPESWQRYLAAWRGGRHAALAQQMLIAFIPPAPTPPATASGTFEVQLGAWMDESAAREALASWQGARAGLLEGHAVRLVAPFGDGPALWRLRTAPLAEGEARALCGRIRDAGQDCAPALALSAGDAPP